MLLQKENGYDISKSDYANSIRKTYLRNMHREVEILAPGGDIDSIKAAIIAGADAVYCGLNKFNARNRAENITFNDLNGILHLAHKHNCQVFITLNISIVESEFPDLIRWLNRLANTSVDGVIIQDFGLFFLLSTYFPHLKIHASTQLTTHNKGQIKFLKKLNATRVNLSRELNTNEIETLTHEAHQQDLLSEVFVHGSYCISFSGICYMSSVQSGNSGNRGRCSQPCRDEYETTAQGKRFPLNIKDNSAWFNLQELYNAGVDSLKIEGRIKKYHYVYSVVKAYKKQLLNVYNKTEQSKNNSVLHKVFNRDFTDGYLKGEIHKEMFIDNPRDYSATHLAIKNGGASEKNIEEAEIQLYAEKTELRVNIQRKIDKLSALQAPLKITVSGKTNARLLVEINTPDETFSISSERNLADRGAMPVEREMLMKRFKVINETEYFIDDIDLDLGNEAVYIPFKELTAIKDKILFRLRNSRANIEEVKPQVIPRQKGSESAKLAVLINTKEDVHLSTNTDTSFYFQLPNDLRSETNDWITFFQENKNLIPWFPSILLNDDYTAAVEILKQLQPKKFVTNNTGIAYLAYEMGIPWIAGPYLNSVNSYTLACLKENFNCTGAFISNELNKQQIQRIKRPADFELHFSIYHPIVLMSSRQCFFQTVTGCEKEKMDKHCMQGCGKSASIKNLKQDTLFIHKSKGNFNTIYNQTNYLNTEIIGDIPNRFSSFLIDLSTINTATKLNVNKSELISYFKNILSGNENSKEQLHAYVYPTSTKQYVKGI
ncbi:MAG: U32 family peptidase [Prolixibacteraceae bacterium]|jgi:putative protease|nr:U32 family peptidase [Prolixibacteraceae bacterium]